jgi:hypothetical protein
MNTQTPSTLLTFLMAIHQHEEENPEALGTTEDIFNAIIADIESQLTLLAEDDPVAFVSLIASIEAVSPDTLASMLGVASMEEYVEDLWAEFAPENEDENEEDSDF